MQSFPARTAAAAGRIAAMAVTVAISLIAAAPAMAEIKAGPATNTPAAVKPGVLQLLPCAGVGARPGAHFTICIPVAFSKVHPGVDRAFVRCELEKPQGDGGYGPKKEVTIPLQGGDYNGQIVVAYGPNDMFVGNAQFEPGWIDQWDCHGYFEIDGQLVVPNYPNTIANIDAKVYGSKPGTTTKRADGGWLNTPNVPPAQFPPMVATAETFTFTGLRESLTAAVQAHQVLRVSPCAGQLTPGNSVFRLCCPVALQDVYSGVAARLQCWVRDGGDESVADVDSKMKYVNIPLSAGGAYSGGIAVSIDQAEFQGTDLQPAKADEWVCRLRFIHNGQTLKPGEAGQGTPYGNPASVDPAVYTSKAGTPYRPYCSGLGKALPAPGQGGFVTDDQPLQFTGQRSNQLIKEVATPGITPVPEGTPPANKPRKKIKAKIKAVAVVKGDNLFDPSGQTAAVPTSGNYVGSFAVVRDPCKLEGKIGLARGGQTLTAATRGATLDVSGGPPFVKVSGPAAGNPAALSGNGTAAGQSANVSASANFGGGGRNSLTMDYVMTLPGRCAVTTTNAGANAVVYKFTGQKR